MKRLLAVLSFISFNCAVMRSILPSQGEFTVVVALLVSTSITSWSSRTFSPGLTSSLITVASAIDSPNCGMIIGTCGMLKNIAPLHPDKFARFLGNRLRGRPVRGPKVRVIRDRCILRVQPQRWRIQ